jgi:putative membrane protein
MVDFIVRTAITAVALWVAVVVLPQIQFDIAGEWWQLVVIAIVFGLINSLVKPIVKLLALPIRLMTLGLISFVINAAMLLLLAWVAGQLDLSFRIGTFPPDLDIDALVGALLGSIIISVVSTVLGVFDRGRRAVM